MKLYNINKTCFLFLLGLISLFSCETTEETYEQFTKNGEAIIVGKPISLEIKSGNQRASFSIEINADPKIKKGKITWVNKNATTMNHVFDVIRTSNGFQMIEVLVENIDEGTRIFNTVMLDGSERKSLTTEITKVIYGSVYQSNLLPRAVSEIVTFADGSATVNLSNNITDGMVETVLRFEDASGVAQEIKVANDENTAAISSYNNLKKLSIFSNYKPEENAIDLFSSSSKEYTFPRVIIDLDFSKWQLVTLPGDLPAEVSWWAPLNLLVQAWDGNTDTYASAIGPAIKAADPNIDEDVAAPHHFTVNLGLTAALELEQIKWDTFSPYPDIHTKKYQIWGIEDITDAETSLDARADLPAWETEMETKGWVKLLEDTRLNNSDKNGFTQKINNETKVKFIRIVILDKFDPRAGNLDFAWGDIYLKAYQ